MGGLFTAISGFFIFNLVKGKGASRKAEEGKTETSIDTGDNGDYDLGLGEVGSKDAQRGNDTFPLLVGMRGGKIYVLQSALNKLGQNLTLDGSLGQKTYMAITNISGWGFGSNIICSLSKICDLEKSQWENIISKAKQNGFNLENTWKESEKYWIK